MAKWLSTGNYLVVSVGGSRPITLEMGTEKYNLVLPLLKNGVSDNEILQIIDTGRKIEEYSEGAIIVDHDTGTVLIDGVEVHDSITDRIVGFCQKNVSYLPLLAFWRNIQENPSYESKKHLFLFLEANKMPITDDGCFLAYKKVKYDHDRNLVDCHSGTFCNNIGSVITMDRNMVNPDRQTTCSTGLHVAAYDYAQNSYSGHVLLEVKVNPRDVVAVPSDYSNQKMRVCRYEVMSINSGKEINTAKTPLITKDVERGKRKHSKKEHGQSKKAFKAEMKKIHEDHIEDLKCLPSGSVINDFNKLTAKEIIEITLALTGVDIMENKGNEYLKNKKSIISRAQKILDEAGYKVI